MSDIYPPIFEQQVRAYETALKDILLGTLFKNDIGLEFVAKINTNNCQSHLPLFLCCF